LAIEVTTQGEREMGTWILIILFTASQKGGATTAEFNSKEACMAAAKEVQEQTSRYFTQTTVTICAAKGEKK